MGTTEFLDFSGPTRGIRTTWTTFRRMSSHHLLKRIDEHLRTGVKPDYSMLTIEHLASEASESANMPVEAIANVGNLILCEEAMNNKLASKPIVEKKKLLETSDVPLDPVLKAATKWEVADINKRARALAKLPYEKIFKF